MLKNFPWPVLILLMLAVCSGIYYFLFSETSQKQDYAELLLKKIKISFSLPASVTDHIVQNDQSLINDGARIHLEIGYNTPGTQQTINTRQDFNKKQFVDFLRLVVHQVQNITFEYKILSSHFEEKSEGIVTGFTLQIEADSRPGLGNNLEWRLPAVQGNPEWHFKVYSHCSAILLAGASRLFSHVQATIGGLSCNSTMGRQKYTPVPAN